MSRFSDYQFKQYERLFLRFAGKEKTVPLAELGQLLLLFGPRLADDQLKELIYRYDRSCEGQLCFEDFLELLSDYEYVVERGYVATQALEVLQGRDGHGLSPEKLIELLKQGDDPLTDEEIQKVFGSVERLDVSDFVRMTTSDLQWVDSKPPPETVPGGLARQISVRVYQAFHLHVAAKPKVRSGGIEYQSLDPYVCVTVGDISKETSVLLGEVRPEWNQELSLSVRLPSRNPTETQYWVEQTRLYLHLYDYCGSGVTPYGDYLGSASLPMSSVLNSVGSPVTHILPVRAHHIGQRADERDIKLEVAVQCSADGVVEHAVPPTEAWVRHYADKLRHDLALGPRPAATGSAPSAVPAGGAAPAADEADDGLFAHCLRVYEDVRGRFPRRHFQLFALDEYNTLRPVCCFVKPMAQPERPETVAKLVADIPAPHDVDVPGQHAPLPARPTLPALQCASPSLMLFRGFATPFEHAYLLCSLLLGCGQRAYVCLGQVAGHPHAWVVTLQRNPFAPPPPPTPLPPPPIPPSAVSPPLTDSSAGPALADAQVLSDPTLPPRPTLPVDPEQIRALRNILFRPPPDHGSTPSLPRTGSDRSIFDPDKFVHRGERDRVPTVAAVHWESLTGQQYADGEGHFEKVWAVFNHENVWLNQQRSDVVGSVEWDLDNAAQWRPLLTADIRALHGPVECWYGDPPFLLSAMSGVPSDAGRRLLRKLALAVQEYRRRELFIPETRFHRGLCQLLARTLDTVEHCTRDRVLACDAEMQALLPPGSICVWRQFRFATRDWETILRQLVWTQVLDCSDVPCAYILHVLTSVNVWGMPTTWVFVGYITDVQGPIDRMSGRH